MKTARRTFFICIAIMSSVVIVDAQEDRHTQESSVVVELRKALADRQVALARMYFSIPAVEGIALKYDVKNDGGPVATVAFVVNRRAPKTRDLGDLLAILNSDGDDQSVLGRLGFKPIKGLRVAIQREFVETDPLKGFGVSVGGSTSNKAGCFEGTIGAAVVDRKDGNVSGYLTCNHVAAAEGPLLCPNAKEAKEVVPATAKTECQPGRTIGQLLKITEIKFGPLEQNAADAAFVQAKDVVWDGCPIFPNGDFYYSKAITPRLRVRKCGAGSDYTDNGFVEWPDVLIRVPFIPCGPTITFIHQILVRGRGFAVAGDSGSLATDKDGKAVGLIFAGDESDSTFLNPAGEVLDLLHVDLVKRSH